MTIMLKPSIPNSYYQLLSQLQGHDMRDNLFARWIFIQSNRAIHLSMPFIGISNDWLLPIQMVTIVDLDSTLCSVASKFITMIMDATNKFTSNIMTTIIQTTGLQVT